MEHVEATDTSPGLGFFDNLLVPDSLNIDLDYDISEQIPPQLSETFSYLGSQIWYFIQSMNSEYASGISSQLGFLPFDVSLPDLKKKQFVTLRETIKHKSFLFGQIGIKVFVNACLNVLD